MEVKVEKKMATKEKNQVSSQKRTHPMKKH
jgi:hypothetical protein